MNTTLDTSRTNVRDALRWWRLQHPEFRNAKSMHHGWYGWCVFAHYCHEWSCVAQMADVLKEFENRERD